ncbi:hypothetical protein EVAR_69352_1 [Eumeta japonica]|uniref:Uncharacterized protein n=1 Tax=Eumeta variegata TaxID=151549 RepID=A0A4C1ZZA6_EUMVA|nr:hypothetical protein EVAR_69352_1 [Eumeta japonica]
MALRKRPPSPYPRPAARPPPSARIRGGHERRTSTPRRLRILGLNILRYRDPVFMMGLEFTKPVAPGAPRAYAAVSLGIVLQLRVSTCQTPAGARPQVRRGLGPRALRELAPGLPEIARRAQSPATSPAMDGDRARKRALNDGRSDAPTLMSRGARSGARSVPT